MARTVERYHKSYNGVMIDITASTKKALEAKVRQRKDDIDAGIINSEVTVKAWGDKWLELKRPVLSEPVYKLYKSRLTAYVYPVIGTLQVRNVVHTDIVSIINAHADQSVWTRVKLRSVMAAMFEAAVADKIISASPVAKVTLTMPTRSSRRALTDNEAALLLKACDKSYAGLWIKFLYYTGVRPQESVPLTWDCINKKTHEVIIKSALKATDKVGETKTASSVRRVIIPEPYYSELMTHEGEPKEFIFQTEYTKNTDRGGKMMHRKSMRVRWENIKREMDILAGREVYRNKLQGETKLSPDLKLYCLRHTYCTNLCRAGIPLKTAIELMGHSNAKMVMTIYGHYTADQAEAARNMLTAFYTNMVNNVVTNTAQ
jgi:Site-specific recombinase XerD